VRRSAQRRCGGLAVGGLIRRCSRVGRSSTARQDPRQSRQVGGNPRGYPDRGADVPLPGGIEIAGSQGCRHGPPHKAPPQRNALASHRIHSGDQERCARDHEGRPPRNDSTIAPWRREESNPRRLPAGRSATSSRRLSLAAIMRSGVSPRVKGADQRAHAAARDAGHVPTASFQCFQHADGGESSRPAGAEPQRDSIPAGSPRTPWSNSRTRLARISRLR